MATAPKTNLDPKAAEAAKAAVANANPANLVAEGNKAAADTVLDPKEARPDAAAIAAAAPVLDAPKQSSLDAVAIATAAAAEGKEPTPTAPVQAAPAVPAAIPAPKPAPTLAEVGKVLAATPAPENLSPNDQLIAKANEEAAKRPQVPDAPGADAQAALAERNAANAAKSENLLQIEAALENNPTPAAAEILKAARISGSPMILVAAQIARKAADDAEAAARAALPDVAAIATLNAPAGTAASDEGALKPSQAPISSPKVVAVGPGANALKQTKAADAAVEGEELVRINMPRKIHLTMPDYSTIIFEKGFGLCPSSLITDDYLLRCGMQVIPDVATRVLEPVQKGEAAKTAPVETK